MKAAGPWVISALAAIGASIGSQSGSGPVGVPITSFSYCLARVCVGLSEKSALTLYGPGHLDRPDRPSQRCYQLNSTATYMTVSLGAEDIGRPITGVLVTSEPVCAAAEPATVDESQLVTCEQIRLGDPIDKVQTLGLKQRTAAGKGYLWPNKAPEIAQFDYPCFVRDKHGAMASAYVRAGRVVGIALWSQDF